MTDPTPYPAAGGAVAALLGTGPGTRADARRNADRLVAAAREAVAEVGVDVTAHEIARRAGVGVGTFYRRLPSREALLEAVLADLIDEMIGLARTAATDPDPWHGFATFAERYVRLRTASCGMNEALGDAARLDLTAPLAALRTAIRDLVERGRDAGVVRRDVAWEDVPFALAGAVPAGPTIGLSPDPDQWRRTLDVVLAGLRAGPG